jgi:hypothetical protein
VRGTLKAVGVLEHHYILCQKHNAYLVAVAVETQVAAILDYRNYQEGPLHSFAGVEIPVANSRGGPVEYLGIHRQSKMEPG